ncbi:MAG: N-acetylmuramoyl-L-alanine amidase [Gaiellaceae bacterium]
MPLICLDPGHATLPAIARQTEPIGPGSRVRKIKDGGGAPGEAPVALAIAQRTRALLERAGYRVAMTRSAPGYAGGNIARARFCNARRAALMIRIHADGSTDSTQRGVKTLVPALRRGWTDDIYMPSLSAARKVQAAVVRTTGAKDLGLVPRSDLTGFNWADVPAILVETGFMTNPAEGHLLRTTAYQLKVARGLAAGAEAYAPMTRTTCKLAHFTLSVGFQVSPATGQHPLTLQLRNDGPRCGVDGYPNVVLRDRHGAIPFAITHRGDQMVAARAPTRFVVDHGRSAFVMLNNYRCDLGTKRAATVVQVGGASLRLRDPLSRPNYCGPGDPGSTIAVSPFVRRLRDALRFG